MKIIVFGATGGIGRQVVEQALAANHQVTAVARRPAAITTQHERLQVIRGDVLEPDTFKQALAGQDAVVSALGVVSREPTTLYSAGNANIMQAMQSAGVRRIMCISATGLNPGPRLQRLIAKPLLWMAFGNMYSDLVRMENVVKASGLDWTIIRPPRLTDGPRTGHYQIVINKQLSHGMLLSRADVADFIVNHLQDRATYCGMVEIAY